MNATTNSYSGGGTFCAVEYAPNPTNYGNNSDTFSLRISTGDQDMYTRVGDQRDETPTRELALTITGGIEFREFIEAMRELSGTHPGDAVTLERNADEIAAARQLLEVANKWASHLTQENRPDMAALLTTVIAALRGVEASLTQMNSMRRGVGRGAALSKDVKAT